MVKKRGKSLYVYFKPFKDKKIGVRIDAATIREAEQIEGAVLRACRTGNYAGLDPIARETCFRMFRNQQWEMPEELSGYGNSAPREELSFWRASRIFIEYPEIHNSPRRPRYDMCLAHLAAYFGKDRSIKTLWVPDIKEYQAHRLQSGASPSTVNWEKATLSKLFQVLVETRLVEANPVRLVKNLPQKSEERQVYLAFKDVVRVSEQCPKWFRPIVWTAFYTGMRRGELLSLTRKHVNLKTRIITLTPEHTKEAHWKRVPIHQHLIPILEETLRVTCLGTDRLFVLIDGKSVRPLELETFKNPWPRACDILDLPEPWPRFHDLRHTWRTNGRRSGMDPQIAESIMGHWFKGKTVNDRYGRISNEELVRAIDAMTFDHGKTEILVASDRPSKKARKQRASKEKGNKRETIGEVQKKRPCAARA